MMTLFGPSLDRLKFSTKLTYSNFEFLWFSTIKLKIAAHWFCLHSSLPEKFEKIPNYQIARVCLSIGDG